MERVNQVKRQEWPKEGVNKSYRILNNFGKNEGVQIWAEIAGIKKSEKQKELGEALGLQ